MYIFKLIFGIIYYLFSVIMQTFVISNNMQGVSQADDNMLGVYCTRHLLQKCFFWVGPIVTIFE